MTVLWTTSLGGSIAQGPGCWSNGEWKIPGVSPRGIRDWQMGVQVLKELRRRGPNLTRVQGAREGFLEETMEQLS